jgi:hypothetical protein
MIPHTANEIQQNAFIRCSNLTTVVFCAEIEAIVSCKAMRDRWNHRVHGRNLIMDCFLVKHDFP